MTARATNFVSSKMISPSHAPFISGNKDPSKRLSRDHIFRDKKLELTENIKTASTVEAIAKSLTNLTVSLIGYSLSLPQHGHWRNRIISS